MTMMAEAEIRKWVEELIEKMRSIKAEARRESYGTPNYENHLMYSGFMKDMMACYNDLAVLLRVLNEPITEEIDLLTRLSPVDEENILKIRTKIKSKRG